MKTTQQHKPLAITMGEPSGVGPELIARIWEKRRDNKLLPFCMIGSPDAISKASKTTPIEVIDDISKAGDVFESALPVLNIDTTAPIKLGELNPSNGQAVINSIELATELALSNKVSGIVTAPIHKAALYSAGFDAPGHTEFLARLSGKKDDHSVMMLAAHDLRVVPVTIHIPLKDVAKQLTADKIVHVGLVTAQDLKYRFGIEQPRIAIAGLNPHAGENGTIGMEEATHIMPAIWELRDHGVDVSDPLPADTLFHAEARSKYDAVLCMYHDQALIPIKTVDFWGGVNITLGLPFIRTSPDHGTALELAGKNIARIDSMLAAIKMAEEMAARQLNHD
ncbi:4-hydroxythreonine-4-phosphate dehydrogenase PdxA [Kordiimonas sp. SCSIO 12603]|uniref:4-hydroxythreonine-4-phosphate dehydrogenase PdxA n=1 Tax=Kordiimonas sp. SCSIO 12603 TaxID=2829596 RepID=UPI002102E5F0|nr:4-hydroxythreonine-4-phosphate dehydrogenase PdxA [Kordiimonas sp. SCSIO 12603]UTW57347.1 4-hydroxythreonine-4-phosphate dehydrogenase PdxA [Kordiimonas sp. SCSIO 12603]